ncbi:MAG: GNAT family N-acetyltransferase [Alphaproteobacteria bacterium]|nr:GNAT family N-acetyltransferase [Alphaproteobacteria bacterium]
MKLPKEYCNLVYDQDNRITEWVCKGLGFDRRWLDKEFHTFGFYISGKLIGGLIYHNIRPFRDLWWTIYTTDKRWCNRRNLKKIFEFAFNFWQVERISILVSTNNYPCIKLIKKLGFQQEGLLRNYRDDGADCYFYGLLKTENKWSK